MGLVQVLILRFLSLSDKVGSDHLYGGSSCCSLDSGGLAELGGDEVAVGGDSGGDLGFSKWVDKFLKNPGSGLYNLF